MRIANDVLRDLRPCILRRITDGQESVDYASLNGLLVEQLGWIQDEPEYLAARADWQNEVPGPHVVYGDVLVPVLVRLLSETPGSSRLREAFSLIELLAADDNPKVSEVAVVSVLEGLHGYRQIRYDARRLMGPVSRDFAQKLEAAWGS